MTKKEQIEEILLTDYGCFDDFTVDKLCDLFGVSGTLDLDKMEKKVDELLDNFSVEDFEEWRKSKG